MVDEDPEEYMSPQENPEDLRKNFLRMRWRNW